MMSSSPPYAELACVTNFSFLRGASHPSELVKQAAELGLQALAIADRNSLAGVVRAHDAARELKFRIIPGARLVLRDGAEIVALPTDRAAYGRLSRLLTLGKMRAEKGQCHLDLDDLLGHGAGMMLIVLPGTDPGPLEELTALESRLRQLAAAFPGAVFLAGQHHLRGNDEAWIERLNRLAESCNTPLVASNDVHYHAPERRILQDVLTCIREGCTIDEAGYRLFANAERHLKSPAEMARLFARWPEAVARTVEIAERCRFSLDELRYEYPDELTTGGRTPQQELEKLAREGARWRYAGGVPEKIQKALDHELALIASLDYAPYFLTVYDLVRFAKEQTPPILCQGRGSAANSTVCYCLGVTSVDPATIDLLFERFISAERREPPDIDVDFEHERREEVIQYVYRKYGRDRAGIAATVISYRSRSALREVGKAMGLSLDLVGALSGQVWAPTYGKGTSFLDESRLREHGLDPADSRLTLTLALARELKGFPRHLSQHVGGFVISRGLLSELVPIENAAMADRTFIEWDKDDLMALGLMKVDVLALGMLTCTAKSFDLLRRHYGKSFDLATLSPDDPTVYEMLGRADSIGVFQVESRAQMTMLPRLKPRNFYDLVIEVAIVRPGPIQGDMVHPYLRRRDGIEPVSYPSRELEQVLGKTLGVPLFQEQAMRIAIVAAGFTPDESDRLRRAMATFRHVGTIHMFERKLIEGMVANGYERAFAERCFNQIKGFGEYGFPESHAASFAHLVYVSAWIKCHYPEIFACAILNSQPMGFYAPAQLVRDAIEHGVEVRPVDVNFSEWDCTLELGATSDGRSLSAVNDGRPANPVVHGEGRRIEQEIIQGGQPAPGTKRRPLALRLGFRQVKGLGQGEMETLAAARGNGFGDPNALWRRSGLPERTLAILARADAFRSMGLDRREALWAVKGLPSAPLPLFEASLAEEQGEEAAVDLPRLTEGEHVAEDYASQQLSLKRHPMALLREVMTARGYRPCARLKETADGTTLSVAGLVLVRQRPGTASGVIFATLEDETGIANIVIWPRTFERYRRELLGSNLLGVTGKLQREGEVIHLVADRLVDLTRHLTDMADPDLPPVASLARADEVRKPGQDVRNREVGERARQIQDRSYPSRNFH
ncbi:MAG TPA: error-prone DNA polymerase [Hypericibacter adhaerens]|nr:error-prone DNA polymerase [Hypericibacter adhaerens]HWA44878.1 error-prone DNA polymerase [Hypericibacter adhaerens]